jgi:hypothetical protein
MCMFCAVIPATLAVGTAAHGRQTQAPRRAGHNGEAARPKLPVIPVTAVTVVALSVCAVVNHALLRGVMPL